jgi:hypothetical protein
MFVATNTSVQRGAASLLSSAARYLPVPTSCIYCTYLCTFCTHVYLLYRYVLCRAYLYLLYLLYGTGTYCAYYTVPVPTVHTVLVLTTICFSY